MNTLQINEMEMIYGGSEASDRCMMGIGWNAIIGGMIGGGVGYIIGAGIGYYLNC